jgi:hypothetical protein
MDASVFSPPDHAVMDRSTCASTTNTSGGVKRTVASCICRNALWRSTEFEEEEADSMGLRRGEAVPDVHSFVLAAEAVVGGGRAIDG